jgi:hypothetical protein
MYSRASALSPLPITQGIQDDMDWRELTMRMGRAGDKEGAPRGRRGRTGEYLEYPQRAEAQNNAANGGDAHSISSRGHTQSTLEVEGVSFGEGGRERAGVGSWFGCVTMLSGAAAVVTGLAAVRWRQRGGR